jgi:primosomal protein N'
MQCPPSKQQTLPKLTEGIEKHSQIGSQTILQCPTSQKQTHPRSTDGIEECPQTTIKRRESSSFLHLRSDQNEAIECIRSSDKNALIIMPTGSGKTTLIWTCQRLGTCSIVFAPFKYLVEQLKAILQKHGNVFSQPFPEDYCMFGMLATADYIVLPYEDGPTSTDLIKSLHDIGRLGTIWMDEVTWLKG